MARGHRLNTSVVLAAVHGLSVHGLSGTRRVLFSPVSRTAVAGRQLVRAAAYASDLEESLHCFLVGVNKSYVIATADL